MVPSNCDHHWQDDLDMLDSSPMASREHEGTSTADLDYSPTQSHGICEIAWNLIQAVDEEEQSQNSVLGTAGRYSSIEMTWNSTAPPQYS